jgi:Mevalonate pyrophosphate decarboxylase
MVFPHVNISGKFQCVSHPTFGIVLLGGLNNEQERLPYHNSAGVCYSLKDSESVARTTLYITDEPRESTLNGEVMDISDTRSPFKMIEPYREAIMEKFGGNHISITSENENIISGSSDAGAAALGKCIQSALSHVDLNVLEQNMRKVSESAGRSFYGGLTITEGTEKPTTTQILPPDAFKEYTVISAVFPHKRKPSDLIHFNQPGSTYYPTRINNANHNVELLKELSMRRDIRGIWELAMRDTDDYHYLNSLVDVEIVTEEMKSLMEDIKDKRSMKWMSYIVTGGNSVFVITENTNVDFARSVIKSHTNDMRELKIAGPARIT